MIGTKKIIAVTQPKTGDYDKFIVTVDGPGPTPLTFPLTVSGTVTAVWQETPQKAVEFLANKITDVTGTAMIPPSEGFLFDTYNSGKTLRETGNKICNLGASPFVRSTSPNFVFQKLLGHDVFDKLEILNKTFVDKYQKPFFRSFDTAFEISQVLDDLNTPPEDNANYLYRICILAVFVDYIDVRLPTERTGTKSLIAFRNWLESKFGRDRAFELTKTFALVRDLRIQYPIHEHYVMTKEDKRVIRPKIGKANKYFKTQNLKDYGNNWSKVLKKYSEALEAITSII
jgi:hypothetical protein